MKRVLVDLGELYLCGRNFYERNVMPVEHASLAVYNWQILYYRLSVRMIGRIVPALARHYVAT